MTPHALRHESVCSEGSCIKAEIIEALDHVVNGNGQPGVVQNLSELKTELREFVAYSKGRDEEREKDEQRRERHKNHWRWAIGLLLTFFSGLLLWLLSVVLTPPLKEKGIISHDTQTYSKQIISTK